jgi:hypothetical protein
MRNATYALLAVLSASCATFGQSTPKFTSPQIVGTFQRLNQTTNIPRTTIYTPTTSGTFRISIVMVGVVAGGDEYWVGRPRFTDDAGVGQTLPGFGALLYSYLRETGFAEGPIRAKGGTPIKFEVVAPKGHTEGSKYNVWVVVEQLM